LVLCLSPSLSFSAFNSINAPQQQSCNVSIWPIASTSPLLHLIAGTAAIGEHRSWNTTQWVLSTCTMTMNTTCQQEEAVAPQLLVVVLPALPLLLVLLLQQAA
jgi:hypothetical protein